MIKADWQTSHVWFLPLCLSQVFRVSHYFSWILTVYVAHFSTVCFMNLSQCVASSAKRLLLNDRPVKNDTGHIKQTRDLEEFSTLMQKH